MNTDWAQDEPDVGGKIEWRLNRASEQHTSTIPGRDLRFIVAAGGLRLSSGRAPALSFGELDGSYS